MRVAFHTLGCKVNQYETEAMKEAFVSRGAEIVGEDEIADVYIVNTCTVTNIADRKSRQYIRRMKGLNPDSYVLVTGCYAQVEPKEVAGLPEVDLVVGNGNKAKICDIVCALMNGQSVSDVCDPETLVLPRNELTKFEDMGLVISSESGMTRAYIKIQEGCDRFCAYCLIPFARGPVRSRPVEDILEEARMLLDAGYRELVLTGINTALYGQEQGFKFNIKDSEDITLPGCEEFASMTEEELKSIAPIEIVLARLNAMDGDFRIRFSSLEPTVVDKNDVERIIRYEKLCHHLHLSAQSGSSKVLKLMNRRYSKEEYLDIVRAIHDYDPLYNITTDIIVGFSGETEEDFADSLDVTTQCEFGKVHIFRYSVRKGTVGEKLPDAVPATVKADRSAILTKTAEEVARRFNEKNFGHPCRILIEEQVSIGGRDYYTGYTGNYIRAYIAADSLADLAPDAQLGGQLASGSAPADSLASAASAPTTSQAAPAASAALASGSFVDAVLYAHFEDGCLARATRL